MAQWSANGYHELNPGKTQQPVYRSWRFWLKGIKKGYIICGLGRDSSDSIGRPFPLIIMGEGLIKGWEKQWALLPDRLAKTWNRMEFVASHRYDDTHAMEDEVKRLSAPKAHSETDLQAAQGAGGEACDLDMTPCREQLSRDGFGLIPLNPSYGIDPNQLVLQCHLQLRTCFGEIPRGVFIGGTPQQSYLAVIQHPLSAQDFVRLWTC